jgi:hypothetical protein
MRKEQELQRTILQLVSLASEKGIIIKKIGLMQGWLDTGEVTPDKILGIDLY